MVFIPTKDQLDRALTKNAELPEAAELCPKLRDLFGVTSGTGYTDDMIGLIMELQASLGLIELDGVVGAGTKAKLEAQNYLAGTPASTLWPSEDADAGARRAFFLDLYRKFDADDTSEPARGRPRLLGLRGVYPHGLRTHRMIHAQRYDDAFVLITDDDAVVFRGATHAYQRWLASSAGAVGSIRPGIYLLELAGSSPPIFNLKTARGGVRIPAFRDNDHDGVISASEAEAALHQPGGDPGIGAIATEIQFHPGYDAIKEGTKHFSSIGCQTAPKSELEFLMNAGHTIDYVLADADTAVARVANPDGGVAQS